MMQLIEPLHGSLAAPPEPQPDPAPDPAPTAAPTPDHTPTPALTPDRAAASTPGAIPRPGHSEDEAPRARRVIDALSARTPRRPLDLSRLSGLPLTDVVAELGSLELRGAVTSTERGWLYLPRTRR